MADLYMERWTFDSQLTDRPAHDRPDNLYEPLTDDGGERGRNWSGHTRRTSLYTKAFLHPRAAVTVLLGLAGGVAMTLGAAARLTRTDRRALGR